MSTDPSAVAAVAGVRPARVVRLQLRGALLRVPARAAVLREQVKTRQGLALSGHVNALPP